MEIEENAEAAHLIARLDFVLWPINMIVRLNFVAVDMDVDAMLQSNKYDTSIFLSAVLEWELGGD